LVSTGVSRIEGIDPSVAQKAPVVVATTANITLSGSQAIDGVTVSESTTDTPTRALVKDQTITTENGIYDVMDASWIRSDDFNGTRDVVDGTLVLVTSGSTQANYRYRLSVSGEVTFGTTAIVFTEFTEDAATLQTQLLQATDNFLYNGDMELQRKTGDDSLPTSPAIINVDEWYVFQNSVSEGTSAQNAESPAGFNNSLRIGRGNGLSGLNAMGCQQGLLTADSIGMAGRDVTLSVYFKAGTGFSGANVNVAVFTGTGTDEDPANMSAWTGVLTPIGTTQVITSSWVKYSYTAAVYGSIGASATQVGVRFFYTPVGTAGADDNLYVAGVRLHIEDIENGYPRRLFYLESMALRRSPAPAGRVSNMGGSDPFSQCHFLAFNGNTILIGGKEEVIPNGALSVSGGVIATYASCSIDRVLAQTLATDTKYYIYAYMLNGVMTLDFSTTTWFNDLFYGVRIKTGDPAMSLVGYMYSDANSQSRGNATMQTIISNFNRIRYTLFTNLSGTTTSVSSLTEINSAQRIKIIQWGDDLAFPVCYPNCQMSVTGTAQVAIGMAADDIAAMAAQGPGVSATFSTTTSRAESMSVQMPQPGDDRFMSVSVMATQGQAGTFTINDGMMFMNNIQA